VIELEIVGKKSTDLQPEGALEGSNRKPYGILYYLNFAFIIVLMLAFILYYSYYYFGINLSLALFFLSMIGLIIFNASSILVRRFSLLTVTVLFLVYTSFMLMIWINNPNNESMEVLKSFIFYLTAITTLLFVFYSNSISQLTVPVVRVYETLLLISSVILIVQMIANYAMGIVLAFPWQHASPFLFRASGPFGEPEHFGFFSAGLLMIDLISFRSITSSKWKIAIVILALLFSFSAFAYIVLFFILLRYLRVKTFSKQIFAIFLITTSILIFMYFGDEVPQFKRVISSYRGEVSAQSRVTKGLMLYSALPTKDKLLGVGLGMAESSFHYFYGSEYSSLRASGTYMNAFFSELVTLGLIGAVFLNVFFFLLFVRSDGFPMNFVFFVTMRFGTSITLISVMGVLLLTLLIITAQRKGFYNKFSFENPGLSKSSN